MKLEFLRLGLLAAALCTASGLADAAFTSVQLNCQNAPPQQVIDTSGGPASKSCSTSGVIDIFGFAQGPFTAAADGFADYAFGSWGAAVTYTHPVSTGTGIGALATSQVGAIDSLTLLAPVAGVLSFTASVNRIFGSGVDFGISAGTLFGYVIALGTDECLLHDSGSCTVSIPFSPGDVVLYNWGGSSDAAVSGSGYAGSGFAFDSGSSEIQNITFRDAAGNPINGASIQSQSGFDYLGAVQPPIPEPETWALMLAGLSGMAMLSRRRRRPE